MLAVELGEAERESQTVVLVSSLPFRSLPAPVRMRSSVSIERLLIERPGCRPGQYAYLPRESAHMFVGVS